VLSPVAAGYLSVPCNSAHNFIICEGAAGAGVHPGGKFARPPART
jgi:hypothetical protein